METPDNYPSREQLAQYPDLQQALGVNGLQASMVVEGANRINNARDVIGRHPNADPTILHEEITDAE